jgi:hypothetical protein
VADQKRHKTPEELGEAVGQKIEELFGGMFADEAPQDSGPPTETVQSGGGRPMPRQRPSAPPVQPGPPVEEPKPAARPPKRAPSPPSQAKRPTQPEPRRKAGGAFDDIVEQMEILVLNLEWEVSPESVNGLIQKFKELERFFPGAGQARTILAMNRRGLQRFASPEAVPHPSLVKLLQDSLAALKQINSSKGKRPPSDKLIAGLSSSYKEIMAAAAPVSEIAEPEAPGGVEDDRRAYLSLVKNVGTAVHSLQEVSQRLARILGVLRQGGEMSGEEITRRLGTLEHLLSERVGQLSSFHKELAKVPVSAGGVPSDGAGGRNSASSPDGLLMVAWSGISLAIPSSTVAALYPISRAHAQQFADKPTITLGSRTIPRLPLKKPKGSDRAAQVIPTWLVHLSQGKKNYFLLVDKSMGFRVPPKGVDVSKQSRIKIGATSYALLNLANFR